MPLKLKSVSPEGDFPWNRKHYHMTFSGWLPVAVLLSTCAGATTVPVVCYSVVHEEGEEPDEDGNLDVNAVPYRHTHFAVIFKSRLHLFGARKFDVFVDHPNGVEIHHPHVAARVNASHMEELITQYHRGRKYNIKTGKTEFKAPIFHEYKLPQEFEFSAAIMADILEANNLVDACLAGNVRPRTVTDIKTLRAEASKQPRHFVATINN